jgi:hypothetical protein
VLRESNVTVKASSRRHIAVLGSRAQGCLSPSLSIALRHCVQQTQNRCRPSTALVLLLPGLASCRRVGRPSRGRLTWLPLHPPTRRSTEERRISSGEILPLVPVFPYRRVRIQGRGRVMIQVHCISGP